MVRCLDRASAEQEARDRAKAHPGTPYAVCLRTSGVRPWRAYSRTQYRKAVNTIPACLIVVWDGGDGRFWEYESWQVYDWNEPTDRMMDKEGQ